MNKKKFIPLGNRLIVKRAESETKTATGLLLPDNAIEAVHEGLVLSIGPGDFNPDTGKRIPMDCKVGDIVTFGQYAGTEVKLNNEPVLLMRENDIHAIVEFEKCDFCNSIDQSCTFEKAEHCKIK